MSGWVANPTLVERTVVATEGEPAVVVQGATLTEVMDDLVALAESRGSGGSFAVTDLSRYAVSVMPSFAVVACEVPPQVFVAGIADKSELGIYILDQVNRWPFRDLSDDPSWRCRADVLVELVDVYGDAIDGEYLTFDRSRCRLTYTGKDPGSSAVVLDVMLKVNGRSFASFDIRIQRPTFSYGDDSYEFLTGIEGVPHVLPASAGLGSAIATRFSAVNDDNLVLLTQSTALADRYYVATINKFTTGLASCYFVGLPGKTRIAHEGGKLTSCTVKRAGIVLWKNLDVRNWRLGTEDCTQHVIDTFVMKDVTGTDGVMFDNTTEWFPAGTQQYAWLSNCEFTRCGQSGNKHPVYIHLRDQPLGHKNGGYAHSYFNNVWSYGNNSAPMVNGSGPQGGCNLKCLSKWVAVRNAILDQTDDWNDPANAFVSSQITSLHSHQHVIFFNVWAKWFNSKIQNFGQDKGLFFQNRNLADSGHDDPSYFVEDPNLPAIPPYAERDMTFTADVATNLLKFTQPFSMNDVVQLTSTGKLPAPLKSGTFYYLVNQTNNATRVSLTATQQQPINILDAGTGTHTMVGVATPLHLNPAYHGSNDYDLGAVDAPFWAEVQVTPISDPANPYAYHKFVSCCRFEFVQSPLEPQQVCAAIADQGNAPTAPTRQFDPQQNRYAVPKNWLERSQVFLGNNTYVGFTDLGAKVRRWDGDSKTATGVEYPYCVPADQPRPSPIVVGGERNEGESVVDVPLPEYFLIEM